MRPSLACLSIAAAVFLAGPALADDPSGKGDDKDKINLPAMSPDKTVEQAANIGGRLIRYRATVGHIDIGDDKGKTIGQVVYTAYLVPGAAEARPVTFAFNGGPGASSVFLNMGAIGPKKVGFGVAGDSPSDSAALHDNPNSWLGFTDLVFIDPVGTGFSRSLVDEDETKKDFYDAKTDIEYLSRVVYDWLVQNERLTSRKYLIGESYGGFRVPKLAYELQSRMGVGVSGMVMVSPYLDPAAVGDETALSPLPWMIDLPAMAAGHFEREGALTPQRMAEVENYTRTQFVTDFLAGTADREATNRLAARVASYTGLDPALVQRLNGRVDIETYLREIRRNTGEVGSVYDSNVTAWDPFPGSAQPRYNDPLLDGIIAPTTSAAVDFITHQVGWKSDAHYETLSYDVNKAWKRDATDSPVTDLRRAIGNDPKMRVMIAHGWDDLSCPYFGSRLIVSQMPNQGPFQNIQLHVYPGGHMFYARQDSGAAFRRDAMAIYGL
ncbi:peptidase S10 [Sphingomonas sp.]|uniref:S10 family peptidase n=1 Tax=Sphingomonas sp. TaxID=28214 RepID=UPI0025F3D00A|nr:peptidase S10 [Sphingomonas sp.]MBV9528687.1 peptidase S10 [Sphingomonas sp.]